MANTLANNDKHMYKTCILYGQNADRMNNKDLSQFLTALSENGIRFYTRDDTPAGDAPALKLTKLFYKPHAHNQLEMICLLTGRLALGINARWVSCQPRHVQVFIPGVMHGEHFAAAEASYRMLWATVFPTALFFHITAYDPLIGYSTSTKRMAITPPMCAQLWQTSREQRFSHDRHLHAKFHYLLMECVHYSLTAHPDAQCGAADYHEQIIEQVKNYVVQYYWENISLKKIAGIIHYSPGHLNAIFRQAERMPLHRYINEIRLRQARNLLAGGNMLVKQVAQAAGFHDPLYFSRVFTRRFGASPAAMLARAKKKHKRQTGTARFPAPGPGTAPVKNLPP